MRDYGCSVFIAFSFLGDWDLLDTQLRKEQYIVEVVLYIAGYRIEYTSISKIQYTRQIKDP